MNKEVCSFFKRGVCRFGDRCRNSHDVSLTDKESLKNETKTTKNTIEYNAKISAAVLKKAKRNHEKYRKIFYEELIDTDLLCAICIEIFIKPTTLNCSHIFCEWCINSWAKSNPACPVCRVSITDSIFCLAFNDYIQKIIERAPEEIKTAYKALEETRIQYGLKDIALETERTYTWDDFLRRRANAN